MKDLLVRPAWHWYALRLAGLCWLETQRMTHLQKNVLAWFLCLHLLRKGWYPSYATSIAVACFSFSFYFYLVSAGWKGWYPGYAIFISVRRARDLDCPNVLWKPQSPCTPWTQARGGAWLLHWKVWGEYTLPSVSFSFGIRISLLFGCIYQSRN